MIKVVNLKKSYGKLQVLKDLNLEIFDNETLVILGRSGVGKSVLLRQIIGIESPDSGYVEVNGVDISKMTTSERYKNTVKMGMLFQGAALFDSMNVGENTAFYLTEHETNLTADEIKKRTSEALTNVGLEGMEDKMPSDLSGGMRKRAALARLINYDPEILLYDEPTTGLDPITAMHINDLIIKNQKDHNRTCVVVTHDVVSAFKVGHRIAFHHDGRIIHIAPKAEFMKIDDPLLHEFFQDSIMNINGDLNHHE